MSWRVPVVVLVLVASFLLGPIAMTYAACPMMGPMCDGPCGMSCAVFSPTAALEPVSSTVLHIVPDVHHHVNVFAGFEPPPRSPLRSA